LEESSNRKRALGWGRNPPFFGRKLGIPGRPLLNRNCKQVCSIGGKRGDLEQEKKNFGKKRNPFEGKGSLREKLYLLSWRGRNFGGNAFLREKPEGSRVNRIKLEGSRGKKDLLVIRLMRGEDAAGKEEELPLHVV